MAVYNKDGTRIDSGGSGIVIGGEPTPFKVHSINHRGYNTTAPENTLPAFKLSKTTGFDMVETDVLFTSDNVPVLLHDTTINRTARNADGSELSDTVYIKDITYEQALQYDFGIWKSSTYAGTKIPSLAEFLALCKNIQLHPYIEIKNDGGYTDSQLQSIVQLVEKSGLKGFVTYISFTKEFLTKISGFDPSARLGLLVNSMSDTAITNAISLRTGANDVFIDTGYSSSDPPDLTNAKAAGVPVEIWTIPTASWITNMDVYITGVTSNSLIASKVLYDANIS